MGKSKELAELGNMTWNEAALSSYDRRLELDGSIQLGTSTSANRSLDFSDSPDSDEKWKIYGWGDQFQISKRTSSWGWASTPFAVDASGRVTMNQQPSLFITGTNNTYVAPSNGIVPFNLIKSGYNDGYSTSTYRFTAPASGKYLMCVFGLVGTATNWELRIRKNGVNYSRHYIDGSRALSGSCIMAMDANDYAEIGSGHSIYLHQTDTYSGWSITKVA